MTAPARLRQNSPEWLQARRDTIGSSDIPIIVGESTYKSRRTLAAEKLGLIKVEVDADTQELFDIGHLLQPALLRIYERRTGRPKGSVKAEHGWRTHPQIQWATASLDGTAPVRRVIEAKWSNAARWRTGEKVPGDVEAQVQWQLFVTGWDVADIVALDRGIPRIETVERHDRFIDDLLYFAREFHELLLRGELPPSDGSDSSRRTWNAMHPADDGTWLPANDDLVGMVEALRLARAEKSAAEKTEATVADALREVIGDTSGIVGLLAAKKNADSVRFNWPAIAGAYRSDLEARGVPVDELDAIQSIHSETARGARPLRLLKGATQQ